MLDPNIQTIHFIGIGGIGMSALAWMLHADGRTVSGSDMTKSAITEKLRAAGVAVSYSQAKENITESIDLVVYSKAIDQENPELAHARELGIPTLSYPELLGTISAEKKTIAVSGTHGKTTTTAMLSKILIDAAYDPTVVVGSTLLEQGSNFVGGSSEYFLTEACEYKRSFLELSPEILVITNIEADHLDYYHNLQDIQDAFRTLAEKVPPGGKIICRPDDVRVSPVVADADAEIVDYNEYIHAPVSLPVSGEYNRENAAAAVATAVALGIDEDTAWEILTDFAGTWRRFEYKGRTPEGAHVYDDYAHHPTEITALLSGVKEQFPSERIIAIFQPHLYSRTADFLHEFADAFQEIDEVIIAPVYEARAEADMPVTHKDLVEALAARGVSVSSEETFDALAQRARNIAGADDVIVVIGAGDIDTVGNILIQPLTE